MPSSWEKELFLGEIDDSRTWARNIQNESEASYNIPVSKKVLKNIIPINNTYP